MHFALITAILFLQVLQTAGFRCPSVWGNLKSALSPKKQLQLHVNIVIDENSKTNNAPKLSLLKEGFQHNDYQNGENLTIGIISARWNADIINGLYEGVLESLISSNVKENNIHRIYTPGAFELPVAAKLLASSKKYDAIICLGCLIKGETMHFEYISQAASTGIMQVGLEFSLPCLFGVLTVLNKEQAIKRCSGNSNEGISWGKTAVEMGLLRQKLLVDKPVV